MAAKELMLPAGPLSRVRTRDDLESEDVKLREFSWGTVNPREPSSAKLHALG
jgi:hypothetical protein